MSEGNDRINTAVSDAELQRRWSAVREAMSAHRVDVLLMQANNDFMGGYVKYLTDVPATNGYPVTVVFPKDEDMTVVAQGPFDTVRELPPGGDGLRRGTARFLGTPSYASAHFTADYDGVLAERALERFAGATVGLLGTAAMSFALIDTLKRGKLSKAKFVNASEMVDRIKAVKSEEELGLIRRTAAMQDAAMDAVFKSIRPGMRDIDVAAVAEQTGHGLGSEQGLFLCSSAPVGTAAMFGNRHQQNRVIQPGDQYTLLIENNGPGGMYTELGRTCVLGKASQEMKDEFEFVLQAQRFMLGLLKPGANCKEVFEAYNGFMRENGRPEEKRLHCHGQGYDMVERPLVRFDEAMPIGKNMNIALHPTYLTASTFSWVCDNFVIREDGAHEKLHKCPQKIFELG